MINEMKILGFYFDWIGIQWLIVCPLTVSRGLQLCTMVENFWGQEALLLLISLLRDLSVNMAVLPSWVLQPPIYLNLTQKMAERFCGCEFPSLHSRCKASAVGLLCKLLDSWGRGPLQDFCPFIATPPTHSNSLRSLNCDPLLSSSPVWCTSLDLFRRSFFSTIANICASAPWSIRLRGYEEGWAVIKTLLQRHICA